jgi:proliferating cell nuclear antigen
MDEDYSKYDIIFKSVQSGAIRTLFEALKEVLTDVNIDFNETGWKIITMDNTKVALVHLKLVADSFVLYKCNNPCKIGICIASLYKLLKISGNNDIITMYVLKNDTSRLHIVIENKDKNTIVHSKLKLLDIDEDILDIPDAEFDSVITMPSNEFQKICRDMSNIAETLIIESKGDSFSMSVEGDIGEIEIDIGETQNGLIFSKKFEGKNVKGRFDLKYIMLFIKSSSLCSQVEIFLKQDYPLILLYSVANLGSIKYVLSPKVYD